MRSVEDVKQKCSICFLLLEVLIRQVHSSSIINSNHGNDSLAFQLIKLRHNDVGDGADLDSLLLTCEKLLKEVLIGMSDWRKVVLQLQEIKL